MTAPVDVLLVAGDTRGSRVASAVLAARAPRARAYAVHGLAAVRAYGDGRAPFEHAPAPRLVLVDLDRSRDEAAALLAALRAASRCRGCPIVGFSAADPREACARGASCCVARRGGGRDLADVLDRTVRFWCDVAALPSPAGAGGPVAAIAGLADPGILSGEPGRRDRSSDPTGTQAGGTGAAMDILLVEDNPGDVLLTAEALDRSGRAHRLHVVGDGAAALSFLRRETPHLGAPRPDLVLLDLNLPGMHGREVLERIKGDTTLCTIPVVVLTSSAAAADVDACYARQTNCYVRKPDDFRQLEQAVGEIERFWCETAELPSG